MKRNPTGLMTFAAVCVLFLSGPVSAGELDSRIEKAVKRLVQAAESQGFSGAATAVFPFQTEEKLAKKRVDFAMSELFTQQLFKSGKFKLIERSQLEAVLEEQKLGLTGAIDSETAAKVGKLVGAQLLLLGSVSRLGKVYQVNVRLVNAETTEIVAPEIFEVPVKVFDEEAARYLYLVPEHQAIGLYLAFGTGSSSVTSLPPVTTAGYTITPKNTTTSYPVVGIGVRYFPWRWLMFDLAIMQGVEGGDPEGRSADVVPTSPNGNSDIGASRVLPRVFRLSVNGSKSFSKRFNLYGGVGLINAAFAPSGTLHAEHFNGIDAGPGADEIKLYFPFVRAGIEWRPQARFGLSVFGQFSFGDRAYTQELRETATSTIFPIYRVSFPAVILETSLALYF